MNEIQNYLRMILLALLKDVDELVHSGGVLNHEKLNEWLDGDVMSFRNVTTWKEANNILLSWCNIWVDIQQPIKAIS